MATKSKKAKKSTTKSYAKAANQQSRTTSDYAKAQTKTATNNAYDFANFAKNFSNPSQFFNLSSLQNYQPANFQQIAEQMIETAQKNLETVTACTQVWVEHAKESLENQTAFATKLMQETATSVSDALSTPSSDPRDKFTEISELAKNYVEQATSQVRKSSEENYEIANKIGQALKKRLEATVEELRTAA